MSDSINLIKCDHLTPLLIISQKKYRLMSVKLDLTISYLRVVI